MFALPLFVLAVCFLQSVQESAEVQDDLNEKVDRLKAELVVFKSLMSDVSVQHRGDVITSFRVRVPQFAALTVILIFMN